MRSELVTPFWREAYASLPEQVRSRYLVDFVAAERWELALAAAIEGWSRVKNALARKPALAQ
ncbi:MAG: hypothetical protein ACT4P3_03775 [Betaproteobacteria bacterium]